MHRMPDGENFVLFGGIDSSGTKCFNDVYLFERASRRWKQQPTINPPVARFVHASAVMHNHLWILGGLKVKHLFPLFFLDLAHFTQGNACKELSLRRLVVFELDVVGMDHGSCGRAWSRARNICDGCS